MADRFANLVSRMEDRLTQNDLPSLVVGIAQDGEVHFRAALGVADIDVPKPATTSTPYSLASITKPFVATLLAMFVERGKIELNRPANWYLGSQKLVAFEGAEDMATIARLANHTSGLATHYQFFLDDQDDRPPPFDETLRRYGNLVFPPGERYVYSNLGYGILGQILETIGEKPLGELLREEIFEPLGLGNTVFAPRDDAFAVCATRYDREAQPLPNYGTDHPAASELFSSVDDLLKFGSWHLGCVRGDMLTGQARAKMQRPLSSSPAASGYATGWRLGKTAGGERIVSHSGGMPGVNTWLVLLPESRTVIAILSNIASKGPDEMLADVLGSMGKRMRSSPKNNLPVYAPENMRGKWKGAISTYAGDYDLELNLTAEGEEAMVCSEPAQCDLNYPPGLVAGIIDIELDTPDAVRTPHNIELDLVQRGSSLSGAAIVKSLPGVRAGNALSYPVRLKWLGA